MKTIRGSRWFRSWVVLLGMAALVPTFAQAQLKIATVDLKKVFEGYYKRIQADTQLQTRATDAEKVLKGMMEDYQKANEDYKKGIDAANDPALSTEEKDRRKKSAESKLMEIKEIEQSITQYRRTTVSTLDEQKRRMREDILRQIRDVVSAKAKGGNYNFVLDTAAETINQTPLFLYVNSPDDLSEDILKELNATAPPGIFDPPKKEDGAAGEKKP